MDQRYRDEQRDEIDRLKKVVEATKTFVDWYRHAFGPIPGGLPLTEAIYKYDGWIPTGPCKPEK